MKIYPNPVSNTLNISTVRQIESVKMYDILGKLVF
ncbi:T9SS type A sorting domain-containing protein [Mariniflexile sp. HNIBRBA6329]